MITEAPTIGSMIDPVLVEVVPGRVPPQLILAVVHVDTDMGRATEEVEGTHTIRTSTFPVGGEEEGEEIRIMCRIFLAGRPCPSQFYSSLVSHVITLESILSMRFGCSTSSLAIAEEGCIGWG